MKNVILIGFMGTGKTTTGRLLAKRLKRPFIDIDRRIEQNLGMSITEIFNEYGESYFRSEEKQVIAKVCKYTNSVIATGGGSVLDVENMVRLRANGILVALTADVDVIAVRTSRRNNRPLLEGGDKREKISSLLKSRDIYYKSADLIIDTSHLSPPIVVDTIVAYLRQGGFLRGRS